MDEQRKHALLFAATILSAKKLIEVMEEERHHMGKEFAAEVWVNKAIDRAAFILDKIDKRWPAEEDGHDLPAPGKAGALNEARHGILQNIESLLLLHPHVNLLRGFHIGP